MSFRKSLLTGLIVGVLVILLVGSVLKRDKATVSSRTVPEVVTLPYPTGALYRQSINNCGPYAVAAAIRSITGSDSVSSELVVREMTYRLPRNYTLPQGLMAYLEKRGFVGRMTNAADLTDNERIHFLREQLAERRPLILLGQKQSFQHYLTVVGYSIPEERFFLYDSFLDKASEGKTVDLNGDEVGNVSLSSKALLDFWRGGGVAGVYTWLAIAVFPE